MHPAAGQDAHPLNAALHQATEIGHLPGHPGREGHQEAHHLEGKGPCQEPTAGTVQKGQEIRGNLTKGDKIIMIKAPFLDPEDKPSRLRINDQAHFTTQIV